MPVRRRLSDDRAARTSGPSRSLAFALLPAVLALGALVAGCTRTQPHPQLPTFTRAAPTPASPAVNELRTAADGANVVLVVIDAARADHVGCYGYARATTPAIDRLASESYLFERHFVQFPGTKPSTASLFTGRYPDTHLAYGARTPAESAFTLAWGLRAAGYHTALFSQNGYASPMWGIGVHFHEAYYEPHLKDAGRDLPDIWKPEALLELIEPWLARRPPQPFFAYLHFMPPHDPYLAPPDIKYRFSGREPPGAFSSPYPFDEVEPELRATERPWSQSRIINLYDGNLLYADWAVGQVERMLRDAGVFDDTIFIVTADHGEAFGEHGYRGHTFSCYDESIRVPLLLRLPGAHPPSGRIAAFSETVDLLPTLCDLLQVPYPGDGVQGRSLLLVMAEEADAVKQHVFARSAGDPPSYVVRSADWAMVLYRGGELRALYDLERDPRQLHNVVAERPGRAEELVAVFREFARAQTAPPLHFVDPDAPAPGLPEAPQVEVTEQMRRSLKALGYVY